MNIRSIFSVALLGLGFALGSQSALAFPLKAGQAVAPNTYPNLDDDRYVSESSSFATAQADFRGIVALDNCSASLVRTSFSRAEDFAMVLTNGHCFEGGFIDAGKIVSHKASKRPMSLFTGASASSPEVPLHATEVIYATMTSTDITLYQLKETYGEIQKKYGIEALLISDRRPEVGTEIEILSGYWKRAYSCKIAAFVSKLKEDQWTFLDSIRYSQPGCATIGGTSGSPIRDAITQAVIGINNTGNDDGARCTLNNPCEVDENGKVTAVKGQSYGQETYWITTCLNQKGKFDLSQNGCLLPKGK